MSGRGHSTGNARELGQKVYSYRSDRRIALKFFHEFLKAVFDGVAWNRDNMLTTSGRAHSTDTTRDTGQKVHNYRSDLWIPLKLFHEFSNAVFNGVAWNRDNMLTTSGQAHSTDSTREPCQKVHNYRSDRLIPLKNF